MSAPTAMIGSIEAPRNGQRIAWTRDLVWVGLLSVLVIFLFLGSRPLSNPDEGRYSEIPREMVATHDYVTPRLDGVKYFEKPPLLYWISVAAFRTFGLSEWSARLGVALFATSGLLLVFAAARVTFDREAALWSTAILGTSLLYYGLSRVALLDLPLAVLMAATLFAFKCGIDLPPSAKRRCLFGCVYLSMGLAVLTKGLIGFLLPGLVMATWVTALNRWKNLRPFYPFSGSALLLAVAAPWHVLVARANPDFLHFYFIHEHFERYATHLHDRYEPWWYFVPVLLAGLFPWTIFLVQTLSHHLRRPWSERHQRAASWFLLLWVALVLLFFSASQSKLIPYITPLFPALAVLVGSYFAHAFRTGKTRGIRIGLIVFSSFGLLIGVALLLVKWPLKSAELAEALKPWKIFLGVILIFGSILIAAFIRHRKLRSGLITLVGLALIWNLSANSIAGVADSRSTKTLALTLKTRLRPQDRVYCLGNYSQDFPVYLERRVDAVDFEGELAFGINAEPQKTAPRFINRDTFLARWEGQEAAYALVSRRDLPRYFDPALPPPTFVAENARYVVLTNQRP